MDPKLTEAQKKMLDLLTETPQKANALGAKIWGRGGRRDRNLYGRTAYNVLDRLRSLGLARYTLAGDGWVRS